MRQYIEATGGNLTNNALGDQKVAAAIIASAQTTPTPGRLTLGSNAYHAVHAALSTRLAELEASRGLAGSTDH